MLPPFLLSLGVLLVFAGVSDFLTSTVFGAKIGASSTTALGANAGAGGSSTTGLTGSRVNLGGATGTLGGGLVGLETSGAT